MWELSDKAFKVAIINSQEVRANILEIKGNTKGLRKEIEAIKHNQMESIKLKNKITKTNKQTNKNPSQDGLNEDRTIEIIQYE